MFKSVDIGDDGEIEGFSYSNRNGDLEYVTIPDSLTHTYIKVDGEDVCIYKVDIPKLIRALQAAYDYKGN